MYYHVGGWVERHLHERLRGHTRIRDTGKHPTSNHRIELNGSSPQRMGNNGEAWHLCHATGYGYAIIQRTVRTVK